jgi:hypothetical protein
MVVGENEVSFVLGPKAPVFLLAACGGLTGFFSIESFQSFFE